MTTSSLNTNNLVFPTTSISHVHGNYNLDISSNITRISRNLELGKSESDYRYTLPPEDASKGSVLTFQGDHIIKWHLPRLHGEITIWIGEPSYNSLKAYYQPTKNRKSDGSIMDNWYICAGGTADNGEAIPDMRQLIPLGMDVSENYTNNDVRDNNSSTDISGGNFSITEEIPLKTHEHDFNIVSNDASYILMFNKNESNMDVSSVNMFNNMNVNYANTHSHGTATITTDLHEDNTDTITHNTNNTVILNERTYYNDTFTGHTHNVTNVDSGAMDTNSGDSYYVNAINYEMHLTGANGIGRWFNVTNSNGPSGNNVRTMDGNHTHSIAINTDSVDAVDCNAKVNNCNIEAINHRHELKIDISEDIFDEYANVHPENTNEHKHSFNDISTGNKLKDEFTRQITGQSVPSSVNKISLQKENFSSSGISSFSSEGNHDIIKFRKVHYIIFLPK